MHAFGQHTQAGDAPEPHTSPIEDYAIIGDTETAALVNSYGSVDWLCLPRFDSGSCFTNILGGPEHGRWLLRPAAESTVTRRYDGNTSILETTHRTATGVVKVTDLMPLGMERADLVRRVECVEGTVDMRHEWVVRFNYGRTRPWISHRDDLPDGDEALVAIAGPDMVVLRGSRLPTAEEGAHVDRWTMTAGDVDTFVMNWFSSWKQIPPSTDVDRRIRVTHDQSEAWAAQCTYDGPYKEHVVRSMLLLRLLTDTRRGGIVAAPTTSLPEDFGGVRNWDYRFCWLRDASLTLEALLGAGFVEATDLWRDWLIRAVAGDPEDLQIMYAVDGGRDLPERELDHLPGYADSKPVRIGNGAVDQRQTDVLGEVMVALHDARIMGMPESEQSWAVQRALVEELATHWDDADNGLWEIRGPLRHFTHSRVMVWAAFDRAIKAVEDLGYEGPVEKWKQLRETVRAEVLEKGFDEDINSFVQHYDTTEVDASLLLIPLVDFLPGDDPRVLGTIARIEHDLMRDGLLLRYRTEAGVDGLPGDEHPFLACSFWLVSAYARAGRIDDAHALMQRLLDLCNDVGLLAEEYDTENERQAGNFPQAFSHLTLVGAAVELQDAEAGRRTSA